MINLSYLDEIIEKLKDRNKRIEKTLLDMGESVPEIKQKSNRSFSFKTNAKTLKELKVACVMDRFTLDSYKYECKLFEVTPDNWKDEIDSFKPDLLFIESAWEGKNKLWYRKIANGSKEFFEMASYCQEKNIPIVFWNKEDPIYTDTFMPVARMSDFVFTTDIDCIKKYKEELEHDNVFHLHFAAQPAIHNPIEKYDRKDKFCFAGAYYHKYKQRSEVFDKFSEVFINTKGFDIYDRNYKSALPEHAFPEKYNKYILGKLDPSEIDIAYKGYYYGINMNSVSQSQTMFARRVFEMLASNTITVGNYSRGVKNLFGDLTICTDDSTEMNRQLSLYCSNEITSRKYRLAGLRSVLSQHLYEDRLNYITEKVFRKTLKRSLPEVLIFSNDENIIESFNKQSYENKKLFIIGSVEKKEKNIEYITDEKAKSLLISSFGSNTFVGVMNPNDYYGKNYLKDLVLTLRFNDFDAVTKSAFYQYNGTEYVLNSKENAYKQTDSIDISRSIIKSSLLDTNAFDIISLADVRCSNSFAIDEFNYCKNYQEKECTFVDDIFIPDTGISMNDIQLTAENIKVSPINQNGLKIKGTEIYDQINLNSIKPLKLEKDASGFNIYSSLEEGNNQYIYFEKLYNVDEYAKDGKINFVYNCQGGVEIICVCIFYDGNNKKISPAFFKYGRLSTVEIPKNAKFFKLGVRISGAGTVKVKNISIGAEKNEVKISTFLSRSKVLVLTNQYPSYDNLYRNMFVHKRMTSYKEDGFVYDVMRMNIYAKDGYSEFEGINIVEGYSEMLENILSSGKIDTVCVHFLDKQMWDVLKNFGKEIKVFVWVHGAEIQPWWRREYNYNTKEELEKAKESSEERMKFWHEVFSEYKNYNIKFIFVSQYFANEIFEDNKVTLPKEDYYIIHNCIDTDMFNYIKKSPEQRKKVLSIRPYASNKYANDLSVKAILELSKRKCFNDLEFLMIGRGELFDSLLKPLRVFKNVTIEKTFLRQNEISELHKKYGIFLTPTRMDAQGVSRDEAMSSGMVAITNAVTAIPEFVDHECGVLVPGEDYIAMADAIEKLYNEPDYFLKLSENAAKRVRSQTSKEFTICKEEELING